MDVCNGFLIIMMIQIPPERRAIRPDQELLVVEDKSRDAPGVLYRLCHPVVEGQRVAPEEIGLGGGGRARWKTGEAK